MTLKLHTETALLLLLGLAAPAFAVAPDAPPTVYREGELIVKYRGGIASAQLEGLKARLGLVAKRSLLHGRAELVSLPGFTTAAGALAVLRRDPAVEQAEPNFRRYARSVTPNDPLFVQQWGLANTGQANFVPGGDPGIVGADLNLRQAWDANNDGVPDRTGIPSVIVAVIDDAIDIRHPDLAANVVSPHNFIPCQNPDDPSHVSGAGHHGTMVSGCAVGIGNNGIGIAGVAWHAGLMPLKFDFDTATHILAIEYARDHGAKIINASFGGPGFSQLEQDLIGSNQPDSLASNDILYVAAAGNDDSNTDLGQLNYPANYDADNIVSAAATNRQDNIASFSQYGPLTVDVAAPGLQIVTTAIGGDYTPIPGVSGTSFSSPYTAGVAALLKSHVLPAPGYREIKARLIESGSTVSGANSKQRTTGGRIDAAKALDMAPGPSLVIKTAAFDDGTGNHALDPGETLDVVFTVRNAWLDATNVSASLVADQDVTVDTGALALGNIAADGEAEARFQVSVAPGITDHQYVRFTLTLTADGYATTRSYLTEIGALTLASTATPSFTGDLYDEFHAWHVDVPPLVGPGPQTLIIRTSTSGSDIDLLAKPDVPPQYDITVGISPEVDFGFFCTSGITADCQDPATLVSGRPDGNEAITVVNPTATAYHLVVVNFDQQPVPYTIEATLVSGDLRPDPFSFIDRTRVPANTVVTSSPVTVAGIDTPTFITVNGGTYAIDNGAYTASEGTVANGQVVHLRVNSGPTASARAVLTIGGVTATFWVNRPAAQGGGGSGDTSCPRGGGGGGGGLPLSTLLLLLASAIVSSRAKRGIS